MNYILCTNVVAFNTQLSHSVLVVTLSSSYVLFGDLEGSNAKLTVGQGHLFTETGRDAHLSKSIYRTNVIFAYSPECIH